jgi:hypothetical protein
VEGNQRVLFGMIRRPELLALHAAEMPQDACERTQPHVAAGAPVEGGLTSASAIPVGGWVFRLRESAGSR